MAHDRQGNVVECQTPDHYISMCLLCEQKVVIHCRQCSVQISGCMCTLVEKIKKEQSAEGN